MLADPSLSHPTNDNNNCREGAGGALQLYALRDIAPGEELTISYTGREGATNQRMMAQYGARRG